MKFPTKHIFRIFRTLKIDRITSFSYLFMIWPSYFNKIRDKTAHTYTVMQNKMVRNSLLAGCTSCHWMDIIYSYWFMVFCCLMYLLNRTAVWSGCCMRANYWRKHMSIISTGRLSTMTSRRQFRFCGIRWTRFHLHRNGFQSVGSTNLTGHWCWEVISVSNVCKVCVDLLKTFVSWVADVCQFVWQQLGVMHCDS